MTGTESEAFKKIKKEIRESPMINNFNFHFFNRMCHMIQIEGELDENVSLAQQISKERMNEKAKNFIDFIVSGDEHKNAFCNLPEESYVFLRDLSAIYNHDIGFHFFHNGLIALIKKASTISLRNHYYRITWNFKKIPLVSQLRLLTWESEMKTDFSYTSYFVSNQIPTNNTHPIII